MLRVMDGSQSRGLKLVRCPLSLTPTLVALPSMSLIPSAPFSESARIDLLDNAQRLARVRAVFSLAKEDQIDQNA